MTNLSTIPQALERLREGGMLIVVDDEDRENEGDLVMAAEHVTEEAMAFMIRHTGGVVCLSLSPEIADHLDLPPMVPRNTSRRGTPYTVSIEAAEGVETGISAKDRTHTVRTAIHPDAKAADLVKPGHVFPLRAQKGGVLVRAGHTEASVDLCRLAGLREGSIISELMHDDGTMMRMPALVEFSQQFGLPLVTIADLIAYRRQHEKFITLEAQSVLQTETGDWNVRVYRDTITGQDHVALVKGEITPDAPVLTRVHSECLTGDALGSLHCDCGAQLQEAMRMMEQEGHGVILYMRQEGRGIGLANKIRAYALQHEGLDTVEANVKLGFPMDLRDYGIGAQILKDIGLQKMRLLTNNPRKIVGLEGYGLSVVERLPIELPSITERQRIYMHAKKTKMGHLLRDA